MRVRARVPLQAKKARRALSENSSEQDVKIADKAVEAAEDACLVQMKKTHSTPPFSVRKDMKQRSPAELIDSNGGKVGGKPNRTSSRVFHKYVPAIRTAGRRQSCTLRSLAIHPAGHHCAV